MPPTLRVLSDTAVAPLLQPRLTVADALGFPSFRNARVLAGAGGLPRKLTHVNVMQVPTAGFARADELILVASSAFDEVSGSPATLLGELAAAGVAALAGHEATLARLGADARELADAARLPLLELAATARLNTAMTELLDTLVASQAGSLRAAGAARDELVAEVLAGGGLARLVDAIARLAATAIAVADEDGDVRAVSHEEHRGPAAEAIRAWLDGWETPAETSDGWVLWPVVAAGSRLGCVAAYLPRPRDPVALAAIQDGARSAAFEMLHELEEHSTVARLTEQFLSDLLRGTLDDVAAPHRAVRVGIEADEPYRIVLLRPADDATVAALGAHPAAKLSTTFDGDCLALAAADDAEPLARDLTHRRSGRIAGVSAGHAGIPALPHAHAQARRALRCADTFGRAQPYHVFDPRSPLQELVHVPIAELQAFERDVLAPLDALPADERRRLTHTLELFLETRLNVADTARRGGWHYNTVRYRVRRLTELLGPFVDDGAKLDTILLAVLLRRTLTSRPASAQPA